MDFKEATKSVYDTNSHYFDDKFGTYTNNVILEELNEVTRYLPPGGKILDVGSGTGNHALFFKQKGFDVLCLDISDSMLEKCREKGLDTIKMDIENITLPAKSFDVVWAYTSLLHVPKSNMSNILATLHSLIKDNGLFCISLKEGSTEGFVPFEKGGKRWFSLYNDDEIRKLLSSNFEILKKYRVPISGKTFLDYLCRKK